ncbi:MAG: YbbR-like domain-containing protein [Gemmatimonadota bacterium]
MDWRGALLYNWRYKISALLLAALLWVNVTANERDVQRVPTGIEFDVRDTAWVLVDPPSEVRTSFEGRTRDLLALRISGPVLRVGVDSVTGPTMRVPLPSNLVSYDSDLNVRPTGVTPGAVEVRFEPRLRRRVPVVPDLEVLAEDGFTVLRPFLVQPDSVTVSGAASEVEQVAQVGTRAVTLEGLEHTVTRELPVQLPAGVTAATPVPASVLVTVEVDSLIERSLALPVTARGRGAAGAVLSADSVRVTLRGAWRVVREAVDAAASATVRVDSVLHGPTSLPVMIDLPEGAPISATIRPGQLVVTPGGA